MSTSIISPAQPEQILKGLTKLWTSLAQDEKQQGKPTVLRACAMTLIVATDEADGGFGASQIIAELMHEHPSRGIIVATSPNTDPGLNARVLAQCWKPFGKAQQICCEQIEITAAPDSWPNIGPTLVGVIAADLPVVFWCRMGGALRPNQADHEANGLDAVMNLTTKVIVDSAGEDPRTVFAALDTWRKRGRLVADLEWTRLTVWREPIAQAFEVAQGNDYRKFHAAEIAYADETPQPCVLYAAAWVASSLDASVRLVRAKGFGPGVHRITLHSDSGNIDLERTSEGCMTLREPNGLQRKYSFAERNLYQLMSEELRILGPDPAFDAAFPRLQEILHDV